MMTGKILVGIAVFVVAVVLCLGLYTLFKGGNTARTWSNKLMRIRILAQAVAIVIISQPAWVSDGQRQTWLSCSGAVEPAANPLYVSQPRLAPEAPIERSAHLCPGLRN
ncbi:MAG: twin transmembrane helix small protein [Alphaproteobacteria bacterium]|nr:twin transmembrane helix small protein [Alphaproteobacteria bacterium]